MPGIMRRSCGCEYVTRPRSNIDWLTDRKPPRLNAGEAPDGRVKLPTGDRMQTHFDDAFYAIFTLVIGIAGAAILLVVLSAAI